MEKSHSSEPQQKEHGSLKQWGRKFDVLILKTTDTLTSRDVCCRTVRVPESQLIVTTESKCSHLEAHTAAMQSQIFSKHELHLENKSLGLSSGCEILWPLCLLRPKTL